MIPGRFIIQSDGNAFEIIDPKTHKTTGAITFGEAVEIIVWLFKPDRAPYDMMTKREWDARFKCRAKPEDLVELEPK